MDIRLQSDFVDYYDHFFDISGKVLRRFSYQGMNRAEMFTFMRSKGLHTPIFGVTRKILEFAKTTNIEPPSHLVVYTDLNKHCGEGKILVPWDEAISSLPASFASEYIPSNSESLRVLQVGNSYFWLRYKSKNDWKSNYGDVDIEVLSMHDGYFNSDIKEPLYAIDFVGGNEMLAVDFNTAPQIRGTGVENIVSARDIVRGIKEAYEMIHEERTG